MVDQQAFCERSPEPHARESGQLVISRVGERGQPWAWVMARVRDQIQDHFLVGLRPRLVGVNPKSRPSVGSGPGLLGTGLREQPVTRDSFSEPRFIALGKNQTTGLASLAPHSSFLTWPGLLSPAAFTQSECIPAPRPHS